MVEGLVSPFNQGNQGIGKTGAMSPFNQGSQGIGQTGAMSPVANYGGIQQSYGYGYPQTMPQFQMAQQPVWMQPQMMMQPQTMMPP